MTHDLTKLNNYPMHHIWASANKLNLYSKKEVNKNDVITLGNESVIVASVESFSQANKTSRFKGYNFYELKLR